MSYFGDWFDSDDAFFFDWFDQPEDTAAPSGNGGVSRSRILGTVNPRPQVPPWRQIDGPVGIGMTEFRRFLHEVQQKDELWGNHVDVEFPAEATSVKIATGLGGPLKGYKPVRLRADINIIDGTSTTPDAERGTHWLQATGPGPYPAKATLYVY